MLPKKNPGANRAIHTAGKTVSGPAPKAQGRTAPRAESRRQAGRTVQKTAAGNTVVTSNARTRRRASSKGPSTGTRKHLREAAQRAFPKYDGNKRQIRPSFDRIADDATVETVHELIKDPIFYKALRGVWKSGNLGGWSYQDVTWAVIVDQRQINLTIAQAANAQYTGLSGRPPGYRNAAGFAAVGG
jgi:hypothetical protein